MEIVLTNSNLVFKKLSGFNIEKSLQNDIFDNKSKENSTS